MSPTEFTNINFFGLSFTLLMGVLIISLPRRFAIIPILLTACFMTFAQRIVIAGLNLYILRLLIAFGWIRIIIKKEYLSTKLNVIDKALIFWVLSNVIFFTLSRHNSAAFINRMGFAFNVFGLYFFFRFIVRDFDDINRMFKFFAIISILLAATILYEYVTGRNLFSILGGVQKEFELTQIRHDRLRCMGPFRHPSLTGTFGALLIPLSIIFWFKEDNTRLLTIPVFVAGTFITIASGSSGPIITYLSVIIALFTWYFRKHMKVIMWGILFALIFLHFYMKAPIWFLIDRISGLIGSGTGWHRSIIIDAAIKHFDEWWLIGTDYTVHWTERAIQANPNMADITNWYIRQGVDGGILTMILFIIMIALCFRSIGKSIRIMENRPTAERIILWSTGTILFGHVITFISITYFDQMIVFWYFLLGVISNLDDLSKSIEDQSDKLIPVKIK